MGKDIIPKIRKDIARFLTSEEGKILKKDIVKAAAILGIIGATMMKAEDLLAQHTNALHNSGGQGSHVSHSSHASHASHGSHGSHGSHASHGSHGSNGSHGSHGSHGQW